MCVAAGEEINMLCVYIKCMTTSVILQIYAQIHNWWGGGSEEGGVWNPSSKFVTASLGILICMRWFPIVASPLFLSFLKYGD